MNSDTPLTDKAWGAFDGNPHRAVDVHFARRLELRCKRLEEALRRFGQHNEQCECFNANGDCTCGLDAAIADQQEEKP